MYFICNLKEKIMGLCKCQKRKVTNLFCFEHDVNVCEYCLVADHERVYIYAFFYSFFKADKIKTRKKLFKVYSSIICSMAAR